MTMTKKTTGLLVLGLLSVGPGRAFAQPRGGGGGGAMTTPVAASLDKVPVGSWAEYQVKRGDAPARKLRHALVGKSGSNFVLESRSENPRGKMIMQTTVTSDPSSDGAVKKVVRQMGDTDPMEMPVGPPTAGGPQAAASPAGAKAGAGAAGDGRGGRMMGRMGARFLKPDPKALVGKETLKVAGGSFAAEHYRQAGPRGGTVDFWINKDVGPFGLVKLEMDSPGGPDSDNDESKVTIELTGRGKGATPEITKPAKPFDPAAMEGRWGGGDRGGGPAPKP